MVLDPVLQNLREKIDAIDNKIIDLLNQRLSIVHEVGKHKAKNNNGLSFIRSGREASMLRNLTSKIADNFAKEAIVAIWRVIISMSLNCEKPLSIETYVDTDKNECFWHAREYYGTFLPIAKTNNCNKIIDNVANGKVSVGILPMIDNNNNPWWARPYDEKNNIYVFAQIPFITKRNSDIKPVFAIANVVPEKTDGDATLFAIKLFPNSKEIRNNEQMSDKSKKILSKKILDFFTLISMDAKIILHQADNLLIQIEGYLPPDSDIARKLQEELGVFARLLGSYALPIYID